MVYGNMNCGIKTTGENKPTDEQLRKKTLGKISPDHMKMIEQILGNNGLVVVSHGPDARYIELTDDHRWQSLRQLNSLIPGGRQAVAGRDGRGVGRLENILRLWLSFEDHR